MSNPSSFATRGKGHAITRSKCGRISEMVIAFFGTVINL